MKRIAIVVVLAVALSPACAIRRSAAPQPPVAAVKLDPKVIEAIIKSDLPAKEKAEAIAALVKATEAVQKEELLREADRGKNWRETILSLITTAAAFYGVAK